MAKQVIKQLFSGERERVTGIQLKGLGIRKAARELREKLRWVGTCGYTRHARVYYSAGSYLLSDYLPDARGQHPPLISLQATRPILGDPTARKFLTHHGIIRGGAR
jgi:hypothetical protein